MHTIKLFSEQDKEAGLKKLHSSLNNITKLWTKMSKLMEDVKDPALFQRAFSPGLQEFIEALCFLAMVESSELPSCDQVIIFFHTNLLKVLFLRNGIEDMNSSYFLPTFQFLLPFLQSCYHQNAFSWTLCVTTVTTEHPWN